MKKLLCTVIYRQYLSVETKIVCMPYNSGATQNPIIMTMKCNAAD
jgi:hypothetical protein